MGDVSWGNQSRWGRADPESTAANGFAPEGHARPDTQQVLPATPASFRNGSPSKQKSLQTATNRQASNAAANGRTANARAARLCFSPRLMTTNGTASRSGHSD